MSIPAFLIICINGFSIAFNKISAPIVSSPSQINEFASLNLCLASNKATPPPATTPSSKAALVACNASSTLSFLSFISVSVKPPTLITATPPTIFANLCCNCSVA